MIEKTFQKKEKKYEINEFTQKYFCKRKHTLHMYNQDLHEENVFKHYSEYLKCKPNLIICYNVYHLPIPHWRIYVY